SLGSTNPTESSTRARAFLMQHRGRAATTLAQTAPTRSGPQPMTDGLPHPSSVVAFTPAVKAAQASRGSRDHYARMEAKGGFRTTVTPDLAGRLAEARSFYLATASADGQPYVQHRGGPPGFVRIVGERTLGFADFKGNRQYITTGNLAENAKAFMFIMDYARQRRVKIWGRARVVEDDEEL